MRMSNTHRINRSLKLRPANGNSIIVGLAIFLCTFYIYRDLGITTLVGWGTLLALVLLNVVLRLKFRVGIAMGYQKYAYVFIAFFIVLYLLRPESRHDNDEVLYTIAMCISVLIVLFTDPNIKEICSVNKIFKVFSLGIATYILFFKIFPDLYWSTIYRFISESSQALAAYYVPGGYGVPIGGSLTLGYYIMAVGMLVSFTDSYGVVGSVKKKGRIFDTIFLIILFLGMIAEGRRGEVIAISVSLLFLFLSFKSMSHFYLKLGSIIVVIIVLFSTYNYILEYMQSVPFFRRYALTLEGILAGNDITSGRIELWALAILLFADNLIFGIGFGGFAYNIPSYFRAIHGDDVMNVHNCTLQLLCETGIIGTFSILLPMIIIFVGTKRHLKKIKKYASGSKKLIIACKLEEISLGIQMFFFVLSQLDPAFYKPEFWGFYGFSIILSITAEKISRWQNKHDFS